MCVFWVPVRGEIWPTQLQLVRTLSLLIDTTQRQTFRIQGFISFETVRQQLMPVRRIGHVRQQFLHNVPENRVLNYMRFHRGQTERESGEKDDEGKGR